MSTEKFGYATLWSANATTPYFTVTSNAGVGIAAHGAYGGGTVTVEQLINDFPSCYRDDTGTIITFTTTFNRVMSGLRKGDVIRLSFAGATDPIVNVSITGDISRYSTDAA